MLKSESKIAKSDRNVYSALCEILASLAAFSETNEQWWAHYWFPESKHCGKTSLIADPFLNRIRRAGECSHW